MQAADPKTNPRRPQPRVDQAMVAAAVFALLTLGLSLWVSTVIFDRVPHVEDEVAFVFQARSYASGQLVADPPDHPEFFNMPFVLDRDGMWFGKYPPGYPVLLAIGVLLGAPWIVNPVLGALAVLLTFIVGRRLYDHAIALLGCALLAISPFMLLQAGSLMSHVAALVWTLLALLAFERVVTRDSVKAALACGLCLGILGITRSLTAAGIALPMMLWLLWRVKLDRGQWRTFGAVMLGMLPFGLALAAYNQLTTGNIARTGYELWWKWDRIGFGSGISRDGHYGYHDMIDNLKSNAGDLGRYLFGWPFFLSIAPVLLVVGNVLWQLLLRKARSNAHGREIALPRGTIWDLFLIATTLSLIAVHLVYWTDGQMYGPRYYFEIIAALALLASRGLFIIFNWLGMKLQPRLPGLLAFRVAGVAMLSLLLVLTVYSHREFTQARFDEFRNWNDISAHQLRAVERQQPHNALIFIPAEGWGGYAPFFATFAPDLDADVVYAKDRGTQENRRLMAAYPDRPAFIWTSETLQPLNANDP